VNPRAATALLAAAVGAIALAGCGHSGAARSPTTRPPVGVYDAQVVQTRTDGLVQAQRVEYTTFDGTRVPALFAVPLGGRTQACLIWENGLGSTKEQSEAYWQGAARIGLATFSIDLRDHGQRGTLPELLRVIRSPAALAALVTGTVRDLERAVTYLDTQPECHHEVAYAGLSLGGIIGTLLTAMDPNVNAAVLMSVPATWNAIIFSTADVDELRSAFLPGVSTHPAQLQAALRILSPLDPGRFVCRIAPRPLLILSGRQDPVVPPSTARVFQADACRPKTIINYTGGHLPLNGPSASSNAGAIAAFLFSHLVDPGGSAFLNSGASVTESSTVGAG
jgi:pimeloyl-ACP methyl ester carboxylesterase